MSEFVSLSPTGLPEDFEPATQFNRPFVSVKEQDDFIEVSYAFPGFYVGELASEVKGRSFTFKEVGMAGTCFLSESGKPLLPTFGRFVQVPPGYHYSVETKLSKPTTFDGYLITPAQENTTDEPTETHEFEYDSEAYEKDELYPSEVVKVADAQNLDSYKVLLIHVRPLQYNALKKQIVGHSNIDVTIRLKTGESKADAEEFCVLPTGPVVNMEGFGNLVLNPGRHIMDRFPSLSTEVCGPRDLYPEFLIIYDEDLKSAAEELAKWKQRKGMTVAAVSIDSVGNKKAKIKEYIRERRGRRCSLLRYVLLFGDTGAIVTEEKFGKTTDHYYFTKRDPDDRHDCVLAWVSGGRIPVIKLSDAMSVVSQIINYEKKPPCDREYYRRMTFAGFFQDDHPQDNQADMAYIKTLESIRTHMVSLGFDVQRVYTSNTRYPMKYKDGTPVPREVRAACVEAGKATDMIVSECSEGQLLIAHRDHGGPDGWGDPPFGRPHLKSILSAYPSIFYSVNCLTGKFDADPFDSFAEDILHMKGGAPSLIAATEISGTWRNDNLMKALFDAIWPGVLPNYPDSNASYAVKYNRLGDVLNYGKAYLLVAHGVHAGPRAHLEIYHVIGDPTLEIWPDVPRPLELWYLLTGDKLLIRVNPIPTDGMLTVWYDGKLRKRMAIKSPVIVLSVREIIQGSPGGGTIEMCASAPGHRYAQARKWLVTPAVAPEKGATTNG